MDSKQCEDIQLLLSVSIDQELTESESVLVSQHLAGCADCCRQLELLGSVDSLVASAAELPEAFRSRVQVALASNGKQRTSHWTWIVAALAAGLLIAMTTLFSQTDEPIDHREEEARRSLRETLALDIRALKLELQRADLEESTHALLMKRVEALLSKVEELQAKEAELEQEIDL